MTPPATDRSPSAEECALLDALADQEQIFRGVTGFLKDSGEESTRGATDATQIAELQQWLQRVTVAQGRVSTARARFEQSGAALSASGRHTLKQREQTLQQFSELLNTLLSQLSEVRGQLLPELDSEVRRRSMQSAYQRSLRMS